MADNGGLLELQLLNVQMGMKGIATGCGLKFYSRTLVYDVGFGPYGSFNIHKYNRFLGYWESVMFSGTLQQTTDTLNQFAPLLDLEQINELWAGVVFPPM